MELWAKIQILIKPTMPRMRRENRAPGWTLSDRLRFGGSVVFSHRLPPRDWRDRERDVHSVAHQITRRDSWVQRNGCRGKSDAIGERHRMLCNLGPPDKGGESRQDGVMPAISKPECTHPNGGHFVEERPAVDHSSRWQR